jgi:hypothetical protein
MTFMRDLTTGDLVAAPAPGASGHRRKYAVVADAAAWSRVMTFW